MLKKALYILSYSETVKSVNRTFGNNHLTGDAPDGCGITEAGIKIRVM